MKTRTKQLQTALQFLYEVASEGISADLENRVAPFLAEFGMALPDPGDFVSGFPEEPEMKEIQLFDEPCLEVPLDNVTLLRPVNGRDMLYFEPIDTLQRELQADDYEHNLGASFKYEVPRGRGLRAAQALGVKELTYIDGRGGTKTLMRLTRSYPIYEPVEAPEIYKTDGGDM